MKCLILAAGYATRLYPLTENFPKPLLEVGGKPILDWLIEDLSPVIDEFVVISNHRFAPMFLAWAEQKEESVVVVDDGTSSNETRLGAVRDILFALRELDIRDDVMVMAGDNLVDFSLAEFVRYGRNMQTSCVMCHEEKDPARLRKTAVITVDDGGLITSYEEKPAEPKGTLAVPPFYYYLAEDAERIAEALDDGCGADAPGSFAAWLSARRPVHAWKMPGKRYDIGDAASYARVKETFRKIQ